MLSHPAPDTPKQENGMSRKYTISFDDQDRTLRTCARCKVPTLIDEFVKRFSKQANKYKRDSYCRKCRVVMANEYRAKNLEAVKALDKERNKDPKRKDRKYANNLKHCFGILFEEYKEWLAIQNHVCAICKQPCKSGRRLAVDHCHNTNKVRGLLCMSCNNGIGRFNNNPELLRTAATYLEETR